MSVFKDTVWQQILDGKREWSASEKTPDACDLFEVKVVIPLRELKEESRIQTEEITAPAPGQYRVVKVMVKGIVNSGDE